MAALPQSATRHSVLAQHLAQLFALQALLLLLGVTSPRNTLAFPQSVIPHDGDIGTEPSYEHFIEDAGGAWEKLNSGISETAEPQKNNVAGNILIDTNGNFRNEDVNAAEVQSKTEASKTKPRISIMKDAPQTWRSLGLESASLARDVQEEGRRSQELTSSNLQQNKGNIRNMCPVDCKCGLITGVTCYSPSDTAELPVDFPAGVKVLTLFGYKKISQELVQLTDLRELSVYDGNLTVLPSLPESLMHLRITNSNLRDVRAIRNLPRLLALNMAHNNITEADLSMLDDLLSLDMSNNPLRRIPKLPTSLTILDLHSTDLMEQAATWDVYLPNLKRLILTEMKTTQPPYLILPKLEYLDMSHSKIRTLPYLSSLPNLKEINLAHVKISEALQVHFKGAYELMRIDLSYTNVTNLPDNIFAGNPKLKEIRLHHTSLQSVGDYTFHGLWNLEKLILSYNPNLVSIDDKSLEPLKKLKILDISNASIRVLPYSIRGLNLTNLIANNLTLLCDCHAYWLPSYLSSISGTEMIFLGLDAIKCADGVTRTTSELEDHIYNQNCQAPDILSPPDVTLRRGEGKTALLECNATGFPLPTIIWISPNKKYYSHSHIEVQPWYSVKFRHVVESLTSPDDDDELNDKIQPLKSGQLLIQNMSRDDVGLYRCIAVNSLASVVSTTSLWLTVDDREAYEIRTLLFGLACAMAFLLTTLVVQLIRYVMDRMGWECCCCRDRLSSRAMQVKKLLESIESYKSQQLERLRDNYNSQVVTIKESCYQQMERLSESYTTQCKNLQSIKDYSAQQLTTARDQYVEQANRVRDYSVSQMNKVSENYVFQRQRIRKFSAHQLFKLRETYKYQQKTLNKILENIPDLYLQNCRTGGSCNRGDSMVFDDEIHGIDAYYRLDFLHPLGASTESSEDMYYTPSSTLTKVQRQAFIQQHRRNHSSCSASTNEYHEAAQSWASNTPSVQSPGTSPSHLTTQPQPTVNGKCKSLKHSRSLSYSVGKQTNKGHALSHRRTHSANLHTKSPIVKVHLTPTQVDKNCRQPQRPKSTDFSSDLQAATLVVQGNASDTEATTKRKSPTESEISGSPRASTSICKSSLILEPADKLDEIATFLADPVVRKNSDATKTESSTSRIIGTLDASAKPGDSDSKSVVSLEGKREALLSDLSEAKKEASSRKRSLSREGSKEIEGRFALASVTEDQEPGSSTSTESHF
ncbi:uncharacterized protein LOC108682935 [Hyalella azteca]|uniref:Uncharacterized protein LOC108682935 n=1 Tax=Hyalella azteca TaxID=294128 RepID=A0A8B7PQD8_HYAAZ|nr:uncharacterized protein LOC108682935 [Hyalella azteca]